MGGIDASPDQTTSACHYSCGYTLVHQEDYAKAGLYSKKEQVEWHSKIMFPSYQEATLWSVTYRNCLADGQCEMDGAASIPLYDLDMLAPGMANMLGDWAKFKSLLKDCGDFLALC